MPVPVVVIGKGLIGAAAAKYLSLAGLRVVIVGPDEPADPDRATVFASHYDSGRVQRLIGHNDTMTRLNLDSAAHYPWLERQSGIAFHGTAGCLYVNPRGPDAYLAGAPAVAARHGIDAAFHATGRDLAAAFPDFAFPDGSAGMFEAAPSGHINPRRLVEAQLTVATQHGASVLRETVRAVDYRRAAAIISTHEGTTIAADRVLVAAGAFTNLAPLVERRLALTLKSETVLLARVSPEEAARLAALPSLLYEIDTPDLEGIYATCPVEYPDGHHYLKMGCNLPEDIYFDDDLDAIQAWFRAGDSDAHIEKMRRALGAIMPRLAVDHCVSKRCILTRPAGHGNPHVGRVGDRQYVAVGNGWSAMASDAIGRVVAHLMREGVLPEGYDAAALRPVFEP